MARHLIIIKSNNDTVDHPLSATVASPVILSRLCLLTDVDAEMVDWIGLQLRSCCCCYCSSFRGIQQSVAIVADAAVCDDAAAAAAANNDES